MGETEYEYGVQDKWNGEWSMVHTNHFHGWYPSERSAKNALAQLRSTTLYGRPSLYEFRLVRRAVGEIEAV